MPQVSRYAPAAKRIWDDFVRDSKNGSFLFLRDYMDYHADRFQDHSLLVSAGSEVMALLPAHRSGAEAFSHMGLTYGGLIVSPRMSMRLMRESFAAVLEHLRREGVAALTYKTVPHIYHRQPAQEDRDLLYRAGAALIRRNIFSVVDMHDRPPLQQRRLRGVKAAARAGVTVGPSDEWGAFWDILSERLATAYDTRPVHSLDEILRLSALFPENIRLFAACEGTRVLGGVVVYETERVARFQYIAASARGRELCALDLLFARLLDEVYAAKRFVDFGSSNDSGDADINLGVFEYKEGFGGRAVAHDWYRIDLAARP